MKIICFSDVHQRLHLDEEEREKLKKLYSFLDYLGETKIDKLIIAGDLFDVWYEYKMVIPKPYFTTLAKLKLIAEKGTEIIYLAGNHDFKFKDFFQKELSAKVSQESYQFTHNRKRFFVAHGDQYTTNDLRYRILKNILRNPLINMVLEFVHPDIGLPWGKWMSRSSRKRQITPQKRIWLEKGLTDFAKQKFAEGFDYVIMGHIHQPRILQFDSGTYINLGDWIKHYSYLVIEDGELELKYWK
ncbi:MAG: UDP-2,3-diacylglucosamine diphosphatase [Candidatus Cloacimonadia bacterium]